MMTALRTSLHNDYHQLRSLALKTRSIFQSVKMNTDLILAHAILIACNSALLMKCMESAT